MSGLWRHGIGTRASHRTSLSESLNVVRVSQFLSGSMKAGHKTDSFYRVGSNKGYKTRTHKPTHIHTHTTTRTHTHTHTSIMFSFKRNITHQSITTDTSRIFMLEIQRVLKVQAHLYIYVCVCVCVYTSVRACVRAYLRGCSVCVYYVHKHG